MNFDCKEFVLARDCCVNLAVCPVCILADMLVYYSFSLSQLILCVVFFWYFFVFINIFLNYLFLFQFFLFLNDLPTNPFRFLLIYILFWLTRFRLLPYRLLVLVPTVVFTIEATTLLDFS